MSYIGLQPKIAAKNLRSVIFLTCSAMDESTLTISCLAFIQKPKSEKSVPFFSQVVSIAMEKLCLKSGRYFFLKLT